jgi:hypothetical protein
LPLIHGQLPHELIELAKKNTGKLRGV